MKFETRQALRGLLRNMLLRMVLAHVVLLHVMLLGMMLRVLPHVMMLASMMTVMLAVMLLVRAIAGRLGGIGRCRLRGFGGRSRSSGGRRGCGGRSGVGFGGAERRHRKSERDGKAECGKKGLFHNRHSLVKNNVFCRAPQIIGCSGAAYDSRLFREFFPTVESCFQIVSGAFPSGRGWPRGERSATVILAIRHLLAMKVAWLV
ncbi:hypothetical protein LB572_05300 [Mesorhizobium sp. BH1-1-5]|uniref:hypothetical protein n=1 Tax=Mesorhizobium sp. BH1-1-5 TaxID=2876661 RepID=UPI001CCF8B3E|nr:hypothetical protein [Mesorhizobium sp. BH1-1-5]MBZ9986509.1 hypothetical protein [Mesorhizobium sp. BH1-1-5]